MPHSISVRNNAIWVKYIDRVDALDVIQRGYDDAFLALLAQTKKVVFDYSSVKENCISQEDTRGIAVLARLQTEFVTDVHVILIPNDDESEKKARYYSEFLKETSWRVDIVRTVDDAFDLLEK